MRKERPIDAIRESINRHWKRNQFMPYGESWNILCTSMDSLGDEIDENNFSLKLKDYTALENILLEQANVVSPELNYDEASVYIANGLNNLAEQLQQEYLNHKRSFQGKRLGEEFFRSYRYNISKVQEGITNNYALTEICFKSLKEGYNKVLSEYDSRYGNFSLLGGVDSVNYYVSYILERLNDWISRNELYKNRDAEVFLDSLSNQLEEFEEMAEEANKEFLIIK